MKIIQSFWTGNKNNNIKKTKGAYIKYTLLLLDTLI